MKVARETLITPEYLREQQLLHAAPRGYGAKGSRWLEAVTVVGLANCCETILDYGAGQASLERALAATGWHPDDVTSYDPAVAHLAALPGPADLVVCTDVLEHVEPACVDAVIDHLAILTEKVLFAVISTVATAKTLSDGRQAHVSLHDREWWRAALAQRFDLGREFEINPAKQWVAAFTPKGVGCATSH